MSITPFILDFSREFAYLVMFSTEGEFPWIRYMPQY